jgi:hypothetical protein
MQAADADRSWMFAAYADWIPKQRLWRETQVLIIPFSPHLESMRVHHAERSLERYSVRLFFASDYGPCFQMPDHSIDAAPSLLQCLYLILVNCFKCLTIQVIQRPPAALVSVCGEHQPARDTELYCQMSLNYSSMWLPRRCEGMLMGTQQACQ